MNEKTRRKIVCGISLLIFVAALIVPTVLFFDDFTDLVRDPVSFREKIDGWGFSGGLIFVVLMALQVVLAVIPGQPFEIAAGYCFGPFLGIVLTLLGAAIGSATAFFLTRQLGMRAVTAFYPREKIKQITFLKSGKKQNVLALLAFIVPGTPKDMLAYLLGLSNMRFWIFMLINAAGRLPGIMLAVLGGVAVGSHNRTAIICIMIVVALAIGIFSFIALKKTAKKHHESLNDNQVNAESQKTE